MGSVLLSGLIVMGAMVVEGITGFGATVFALPFLTMLMDVRATVPFLAMFSLLFGLYVIWRYSSRIQRHILGSILLFSGLGLPFGMLLFDVLPENILKALLGIFVMVFAVRSLVDFFSHSETHTSRGQTRLLGRILLFFGGIFHGAFACGGPLIVFFAAERIHEKTEFRATMSCVWVVFNTIIILKNILSGGVYTASFMLRWSACLPFFLLGECLGNVLHKAVSFKGFTLLSNILLLCAGLSSLIPQII